MNARTVVLVHGALHGAWCWAAVQTELDRRGVPSEAVDLPGHGASAQPLGDTLGNAAAVAAAVEHVVARSGGPVVLVGHSYSGVVIGQAAQRGQVDHLVFVSALVADVGESAHGVAAGLPPADFGGTAPPRLFRRHDDGTLSADPAAAAAVFYDDCPPKVAAAAVARLCRQRSASLEQPVTRAAWRDLPVPTSAAVATGRSPTRRSRGCSAACRGRRWRRCRADTRRSLPRPPLRPTSSRRWPGAECHRLRCATASRCCASGRHSRRAAIKPRAGAARHRSRRTPARCTARATAARRPPSRATSARMNSARDGLRR